MNELYTWSAVAIVALVTALIRFLPFWVFGSRPTPVWLNKLGRTLPYAVMGMLVVYCLKGTDLTALGGWLPTLIAVAVVGVLYVWKRNTLVSIVAGTMCYMVLVQTVF